MALKCFATGGDTEFLNRDGAGAIDTMANYTRMMWFVIDTDRNDFSDLFFSHASGSASNHDYDEIYLDSNGTTLAISSDNGTTFDAQTGTNLSVGDWYHIAIVRTGITTLTAYLNGVLNITSTLDMTGRPSTDQNAIMAGYPGFSANAVAGRCMGYKDWTVVLTADEIEIERKSLTPVKTANLWSYLPMIGKNAADCAKDYSGNGRDYTTNGALITVDGELPPLLAKPRHDWSEFPMEKLAEPWQLQKRM